MISVTFQQNRVTGIKHKRTPQFEARRYQGRTRYEKQIKCSTNSKPQESWIENDTSGIDLINDGVVERLKQAASLQVIYEDLQTYKNEINTYEDWMYALKRLDSMKSHNPSLFNTCIEVCWIPIGKGLVKNMSEEQVYEMLQNINLLEQFNRPIQQSGYNQNYGYRQQTQNHNQKDTIVHDLLAKLEIDNLVSWSKVFDKIQSKAGKGNNIFIKNLVLDHFLPAAEKFIEGAFFSQIYQLLQKVSGLKLSIQDRNVSSFIQKICQQKVLRYIPKQMSSIEVYIDMMSIVSETLRDKSLSGNSQSRCYGYEDGNEISDKELKNKLVCFFNNFCSIILQYKKDIKNAQQVEKISKVCRKFYDPTSEVQQLQTYIKKINLRSNQ